MKELILPINCLKFPTDPSYVKDYFESQSKYNYDTCKYLFMWSTLADKYANDKVYQKNFWTSLKTVINKELKTLAFPTDFKNDLLKMKEIKIKYSEDKKLYNKKYKEEIKLEKEKEKKEFGYATVDDKIVEIGNRLIESSRIFIGRGECKYRGTIIADVVAEDVKINSSKPYPCNMEGHDWGEVSFKDNMSIATYTEHNLENTVKIEKAIWFSTKSEFKADSDEHKFEKSRLLNLHLAKVNKAIKEKCLSNDMKDKQIGCCAYIISKFGIRAGNEDKRDNGVVGASTLKIENVEIISDKKSICLEFLGKDSIAYSQTLKVDEWILKPFWDIMCIEGSLVRNCKEQIFNKINSNDVNKFLQSICKDIPDLSNKTFRTEWASDILAKLMRETNWENLSDKQFKLKLDEIQIQVAKKLNHHKTIDSDKMKDDKKKNKEKIKLAKEKLEKNKQEYANKILLYENTLKVSNDSNKIKTCKEKIKYYKEKEKKDIEKFLEMKAQMDFKISVGDISLQTSRLNYCDVRLYYSLLNKYEKRADLIFTKALQERFKWAKNTSSDFYEKYPRI